MPKPEQDITRAPVRRSVRTAIGNVKRMVDRAVSKDKGGFGETVKVVEIEDDLLFIP